MLGNYPSKSADKQAMQQDIFDLYQKGYIKQWRTVLTTSKVLPYAA